MIDIICKYEDGDTTVTAINATLAEAREYFIGKYFNFGIEGDLMKKCVEVGIIKDNVDDIEAWRKTV